jgi:N-acetylglucosaminyldiphosphoundecaprenol N-acetyl-beta-D-mannosaminyltransferase
MTSRAENYSPAATPRAAAIRPRKTRREANAERYAVARHLYAVLGTTFDVMQIPDVILQMQQWIARRARCHYIAVTGMHGITEARHKSEVRQSLSDADLVVADGMPVVWIGRFLGYHLPRRVYGPELMLRFCEKTAWAGYRHYFLGGAVGVPEQLAASLERSCPGITIVGTCSPPFGSCSPEEDAAIVENINRTDADVLWVGLGTPKQEVWMREHRDKLRIPVMVGVGAAFDLLSSRKKQAPKWMRERGLEWLFRLLQEPQRLWKRYLVGGSEFVLSVTLELMGLHRFE